MKRKVVHVRAGRIGNCNRALALHMLGVPDLQSTGKEQSKIYRDGEEIERQILKSLKKDGYKITTGEIYTRKVRVGNYIVKVHGTLDGMLNGKTSDKPMEIKSMNKYRFDHFPERFSDWEDKLKEKYSYQMGTYLFITEADYIYMIVGEKINGNVNRIKIVKVLPSELKQPEEILARIEIGLKIFEGEEVLPENFSKCKYCSYWDTKEPWDKSPCAKKYVEGITKKKKKIDRPFLKGFRNLSKDIKEREEDLEILRQKMRRYALLTTRKYGEDISSEYIRNR